MNSKSFVFKICFLKNNVFFSFMDFFGNVFETYTPRFLGYLGAQKKAFVGFFMSIKFISYRFKLQRIKKILFCIFKGFGNQKFLVRKIIFFSLFSQRIFICNLKDTTPKINGFNLLKKQKKSRKITFKSSNKKFF